MFSGDVDLNVNNSFDRGFDSHYCYDPQYCNGPTLNGTGGLKMNGDYPWFVFEVRPPAFDDQAHSYTYIADSVPGNQIALTFEDTDYSDNSGDFIVSIFAR